MRTVLAIARPVTAATAAVGFAGGGKEVVWLPRTRFPFGASEMAVLEIVTAGPPGATDCPATTKPEGLGTKV